MIKNCIIGALLMLFFVSCQTEYSKFKKKPKYITKPNIEHQAYFEAYDKTLAIWDVPFEELYITTSFGTAHIVVSGPDDGFPVVLLHGMNASSTMWYPNMKALADSYRVFAIDFILEPGKSFITKEMESTDDIALWYHEVISKLQLEKYHIIGASRGGWLAVNTALHNQEGIKSMVLLSPAQTFIWVRPSTNLLKNIVYAFSSKEKQMEETLETMSRYPHNINKTYLDQYKIAVEKDSINKFTIDMMPYTANELKSLKMPVYVLIGDDDMINNDKTVRMAKDILPYGRGETISNAGHFLSVDQANIVNEKVLQFLNEIDELDN
ncbi:alpha/beta hydrolase [Hanstruepera neustonica]|uniref:Alpha/beta hydrolase n=1 Tax=Hanstruepera neustonica TaxID=1445657 RepID=A0A2K1DYA4_9FLAO|nr:alpha/beta hydrolase [Hanstruepera neustonica]PNQ73009.1 alpha/beta hydrolase [Hanstruepera neustonica]